MNEKHEKFYVGANVFVIKDGKLLLGKRKNIYGAGSWGLPGGHLENREDMKVAAKRELEEETGLGKYPFFKQIIPPKFSEMLIY